MINFLNHCWIFGYGGAFFWLVMTCVMIRRISLRDMPRNTKECYETERLCRSRDEFLYLSFVFFAFGLITSTLHLLTQI